MDRPLGNRRVGTQRRLMLTLISAALAFGVLAGVIAWQANVVTYTAYHRLVDEGSKSVDAALQARAAALDQMGDAATFLATTGAIHDQAKALADTRWRDFSQQLRISWSNISDTGQGEDNVFRTADDAAGQYIQQIGAMYALYDLGQTGPAGTQFLKNARETLNTRLVPALGGLEGVKVEDMGATDATAGDQILSWRTALLGVAGLLALLLLGGLWAVWRMHYPWSWPIGLALVGTIALAVYLQAQLGTASAESRVMVHDAYYTVAGVQDLGALLSQGRALESIAIFDNKNAAAQLAAFDQYNFLVEQQLCGDAKCTQVASFVSSPDTVDPAVVAAALAGQSKYGLPRAPLVANVRFAGQAAQYEALRADYRHWIDLHTTLAGQLTGTAPQLDKARTLSTGDSAAAFAKVAADVEAIRSATRTQFDAIGQRGYTNSLLGQGLAVAFPAAGLLAAWGLLGRRRELFA